MAKIEEHRVAAAHEMGVPGICKPCYGACIMLILALTGEAEPAWFTAFRHQFEGMRQDVSTLKDEVVAVKVEVAALRMEIGALKEDIVGLKAGMDGLGSTLEERGATIEAGITRIDRRIAQSAIIVCGFFLLILWNTWLIFIQIRQDYNRHNISIATAAFPWSVVPFNDGTNPVTDHVRLPYK